MSDSKKETDELHTPLLENVSPEPRIGIDTKGQEGFTTAELDEPPNHSPIVRAERVADSEGPVEGEEDNWEDTTSLIVRGRWRDGLFNCCAHGCCHPSLLRAWMFPIIAIAQVMKRLNLRMSGTPGTHRQAKRAFFKLVFITLFHVFTCSNIMMAHIKLSLKTYHIINTICSILYSCILLYLIVITRSHIRKKYNIREKCFGGCEDICVAFWCPCCTISQMARHTADYDTYRASCCSNTGLPPGAPSIV
mmetsp:Transcript_15453/g.17971  ORF Transcript_15453/g.17971 Transcript_15453/m.17971 type:complete len:249 (-) Transcript_15453:283-1029(-)